MMRQHENLHPLWLAPEVVRHQMVEVARVTALAEMASGLAHELNQPLGAIAAFSQAGDRMLNRPAPMVAEAADVFRQINQEALGAGEAIRRIRRLFIQRGSAGVRCQMEDVLAEIHPVLDALALPIAGRVQLEMAPDLPDVRIDRIRIQHVLVALVQNAVEAMTAITGDRRILIAVSADRYTVETSVRDFGAGLPADLKGQLFHPFFTTKPEGYGLGLASSRAIVESHQGTIGFDFQESGGSQVWFRLPIASD